MFDLSVSASAPATASPAPAAPAPTSDSSISFHELLSDLNPLQYIPVVGTIYRSLTGDTIPESVRTIGSFVFSGLTGGPIGLATSAALLGLEKLVGIDPEKIGHEILASIGIGSHEDSETTAVASAASAAPAAPTPAASTPTASPTPTAPITVAAAQPWSPAQLTAYGVTSTQGTLHRGGLAGSDVLNDMELARSRVADPGGIAVASN